MILTCKTKTTNRPFKALPSWSDTLHFHTHTRANTPHFHPAISTTAPCKLSLIPCCSDPCQACVTFGWKGHQAIHTHSCFHLFIYLFMSLRFLLSAFILSVFNSVFLTHPCGLGPVVWIATSEDFHLSKEPLSAFSEFLLNSMETFCHWSVCVWF